MWENAKIFYQNNFTDKKIDLEKMNEKRKKINENVKKSQKKARKKPDLPCFLYEYITKEMSTNPK